MIKIKKSPTADSRTAIGNPSKEDLYESSKQHIGDVKNAMEFFAIEIYKTAEKHDYTKIDEPGIAAFYDSFSKKLTGDAFKAEPWFQRHITEERHHLKDRCPDDVNLIDIIERISDIVMAGMARSGSIYDDTLDADILQMAYKNTIELLKNEVEIFDAESIKKYRKLPVEIEAVQYDGFHTGQLHEFCGDCFVEPVDGFPYIKTTEGNMTVSKGDYVIRGVGGEFYPCKPDIFGKTYESVI